MVEIKKAAPTPTDDRPLPLVGEGERLHAHGKQRPVGAAHHRGVDGARVGGVDQLLAHLNSLLVVWLEKQDNLFDIIHSEQVNDSSFNELHT